MQLLGYTDFNNRDNICRPDTNNKKYLDFLNIDSIKLINLHYAKDFEYFNYDMIHTIATAVSTITTTYCF